MLNLFLLHSSIPISLGSEICRGREGLKKNFFCGSGPGHPFETGFDLWDLTWNYHFAIFKRIKANNKSLL